MRYKALLLVLFLLTISFAYAEDKVRLEMPDNVVSGEPFKIILRVDDPLLRKMTSRIDIGGAGECPGVRWRGKQPYYEYDYSGEETIEFDSIATYRKYVDNHECNFTITFIGDIDKIRSEYPEIISLDSNLGHVMKGYNILPVSFSAELPEIPEGDFKKEGWENVEFPPEASFYYAGSDFNYPLKVLRFMFGRGVCWTIHEGNFACGQFNDDFVENPPEDIIMEKADLDTFGLSGTSEGYVLWNIKKTEDSRYDTDHWVKTYDVEVYMSYEVFVDKLSFYSGDARKIFTVDQEDFDSELEQTKRDMLAAVRSQRWTSAGGQTKTYISRYKPNLPDIKDDVSLYVWGTVSDTDANPMPYMHLEVKVKGKTFTGNTDEKGDFKILLENLELGKNENEVPILFIAAFKYERDGNNYFNIHDLVNGNSYKLVVVGKEFKIIDKQNVEVHFQIDGSNDPDVITLASSVQKLKHLSVTYTHMHEAVDFSLTKLKANIDYKLPVDVYVGNNEKKTHYDPVDSKILIGSNVASITAKDRPKNREYHEFGHHVMYSEYGAWPESYDVPGHEFHDGFMNPTTGDSWVEGFAEFFAMAAAKDRGDPKPSEYAYWGDLEQNYKPWDGKGKYEEFAVAALLWDLYDTKNEKGDALSLSLEEIWSVIKVKRADLYEYYKAFKAAYPKKSKEIDDIFILHGMFADTTVGNKKIDNVEPYRWINKRLNQYTFVDLANNDTSKIIYQTGMIIGKATNYERPNRTSAAKVENAYLNVDPRVDFYKVSVHFNNPSQGEDYEYDVDARQGLIYLSPLPNDVDAQVTVTPITQDYTAGKFFSENSKDINSKIYSGEKLEQDFELKATGTKLDEKQELYGDEADFTVYDPIGEKIDIKTDDNISLSGSNAKFPFTIILLSIMLGVFIYFFIKKPGFRKKTINGTKKAYAGFVKHGIPAIKKILKKTAELIVKAVKLLVKMIKKGIHAAKPHVKKLHANIKEKIKKGKQKKK